MELLSTSCLKQKLQRNGQPRLEIIVANGLGAMIEGRVRPEPKDPLAP